MRNAWFKLKQIVLRGRELRLRIGALLMPAPALVPFRVASGRSGRSDRNRRQMFNRRQLTLLFWLYIAQAIAGSAVGFTAPFLYFFGVM